jgi:hypothetical protein
MVEQLGEILFKKKKTAMASILLRTDPDRNVFEQMGSRAFCNAIQACAPGEGRRGLGIEADFLSGSRAILYPGLRAPPVAGVG